MSVNSENRWKAKCIDEFNARSEAMRNAETLSRAKHGERHEVIATDPLPTRSQVRRWMRAYGHEYSNATELAEAAQHEFDFPEHWLDDPVHWVWDLALEAAP